MFKWSNECDEELMAKGDIVAITDASSKMNQMLVEIISKNINSKLDWHFAGGRGVIRCLPEYADIAREYIKDNIETILTYVNDIRITS